MTCPGSVSLVEAAPERRTGYDDQGTACHAFLADLLRVGAPPEQWTGNTLLPTSENGLGAPVEVTEEMVGWVRQAATWVLYVLASFPETVLRVEQRVIVGAAFGCPDALWGTPDIVLVRPDLLTVVDAKFGWVDVAAHENPQLSLYTIGEAHRYGWQHAMYEQAILQPRSNPPVNVEMLTRAELQDRRDQYRPRVLEALNPAAPLIPSDECRNCDAAGMCPAYQEWAKQRAALALAEPKAIGLARLGEVVAAAPRIRAALVAAERYALQRLELGFDVPGLKRVAGPRGHRKWVDEREAYYVLGMLAEPEEFLTKPELISPAQAEKKLRVPTHWLDSLAPAPSGAPVLAPEDDPRPALPPVFDDEGES
jgi:hypothetical protein